MVTTTIQQSQVPTPLWKEKADLKQAQRAETLARWSNELFSKPVPNIPPPAAKNVRNWPLESGELQPVQVEITESCPSHILHMIASSRWTAENVLLAFMARAVIAQHLTNPVSEIMFEHGLDRARQLDRHLKTTGQTVGPLHGLPISLKDVMNVEGHPTTLGFVALADAVPAHGSDALVEKLADAGAVFYCKTNVPQGLMSGECSNYLYGRTSTPDNRSLSAGGSSGGEGSLIALRGSPLGIGTDVAGSIRTPANFNGIYGLCPSFGRLPLHSAPYTRPSFINSVAGPMCQTVDGLEVYTKAVLSTRPWEWDPSCVPIPWNESICHELMSTAQKTGLSFGFVATDGIVRPHPPIERGMKEVKEALQNAGHEVVDVELFDGREGMEPLMMSIFNADGGRGAREIMARCSEPPLAETIFAGPEQALTAEQFLEKGKLLHQIQQLILDRWRNTSLKTLSGRAVDVFILPSGGHVAPPHGTMEYYLYEAISNILNWTCATLPVGRVDPELDPKPQASDFTPMSTWDGRNMARCKLDKFQAPSLSNVLIVREIRFAGSIREWSNLCPGARPKIYRGEGPDMPQNHRGRTEGEG